MKRFFSANIRIVFLFFMVLGSRLDSVSAAMIDLAFEAHRNGDLERAEKYYYRALEEGGSQAIIHYNLGNIFYARKNIGDAVLSYRRAIKIAPSFKEAYLNLGRIQYIYGNYDRALEVFLAYKKQDGDDYENTLLLADTYKKLRMYPQALEEYQFAVRKHPYHEEAYIALADFFLTFDDLEGARQEAVAGYDNVSFSKSLLLYEADLLRETQRYDEAVLVYRSLLKSSQSDQSNQATNLSEAEQYEIELKIVDSLLSASNVNYALFELERVVEDHPDKKVGVDYLENVYIVYGKISRGFSFFKNFYSLNPHLSQPVIKNFLADAYNREDIYLVKRIIDFFDQRGIRDELAEAIRNEIFLQ